MARGKHLIIDISGVSSDLCLNDKLVLNTMSEAATKAGATVISTNRYKFGQDSPPGFTAVVILDESHCSVHTYAELGLMAMDIFTCGNTDPKDVFDIIKDVLKLKDEQYSLFEVMRFV